MGRAGTGGVTPHGAGIQLTFYWRGRRVRPTLPLPATTANLRHARRVLDEIKERIRHGTFEFGEYFPDARAAPPKHEPTFGDVATAWLKSLDVEHSTDLSYRRILDHYWLPTLRDIAIARITNAKIRELVGDLVVGRKTRNNVLIPARAVFAQAVVDEVIDANPMALIKNAKTQREPPDPFDVDEVPIILAQLRRAHDEQVANYFEFAFYTGMRPSEQIALQWGDVDWRRGTATVRRARVWGQNKDRTKTFVSRDVELTDIALACLKRQKACTFLLEGGFIFHNPHTGAPWQNVEHQRRMWARAFKVTGLRYREPYQTRHTFATQALMAGANPMWVSRQLGHVNMGMLLKVYSRWIDLADKSRELGKLNAAFRSNATTTATTEDDTDDKLLIQNASIGGVDGTRTR